MHLIISHKSNSFTRAVLCDSYFANFACATGFNALFALSNAACRLFLDRSLINNKIIDTSCAEHRSTHSRRKYCRGAAKGHPIDDLLD
jgi:hypothetical protein